MAKGTMGTLRKVPDPAVREETLRNDPTRQAMPLASTGKHGGAHRERSADSNSLQGEGRKEGVRRGD